MNTAAKQVFTKEREREMSYVHRVLVQHANPATFFMHTFAIMWGVHFAWQHQLWPMIISIVGFIAVGMLFALPMNKVQLATTPIGRWFENARSWQVGLPFVVGIACLFHGAWQHSGPFILLGVSGLVLAVVVNCHLFLRRRHADLWAHA